MALLSFNTTFLGVFFSATHFYVLLLKLIKEIVRTLVAFQNCHTKSSLLEVFDLRCYCLLYK